MIAMIESAMAVRFPSGSNFCSSSCVPCYRSLWNSEESAGVHVISGRRNSACGYQNGSHAGRRMSSNVRQKVRATAEHLGSVPDPVKCDGRSRYHPFEAIAELVSERGGEACLTAAETTRTIVEQIITGLDSTELINDMELSGPATIGFGIEEIDGDEDTDGGENADYSQNWVSSLEDEDSDQSDENPGDWPTLETMRSAHPLYFAKKLAEIIFASEEPDDLMEGPPVGICIQGGLRPALLEVHSIIKELFSDKIFDEDIDDSTHHKGKLAGAVNGVGQQVSAWGLDEGNSSRSGTSFYALDLAKIQLLSIQGHPDIPMVEVEDFRKAKPDTIAHSAADIVSHLKAGGERTIQALKALCWRCKGMQAEEAQIISVDSLGIGVRVCSGTQLQTLRFTFDAQATSVLAQRGN